LAAEAGEHDVEEDEGGFVLGDAIEGAVAAVAGGDIEAFAFEDFFEAQQDVRVVFDDENFGFHFNDAKNLTGGSRGSGEESRMAIGPVQMLVLGFAEPNFTGKIAAELDRLREHEFVK